MKLESILYHNKLKVSWLLFVCTYKIIVQDFIYNANYNFSSCTMTIGVQGLLVLTFKHAIFHSVTIFKFRLFFLTYNFFSNFSLENYDGVLKTLA